MYRSGRYYRQRSKLNTYRRELIVLVVAGLVGGLSLQVLPRTSAAQGETNMPTHRISQRDKVPTQPVSPPQSLTVKGMTASPITIVAPLLDLLNPQKKDVAMQLVSSAENSTLDWRAQFGYIEDIGDGRGYTGGIIGFCSGTSDMLTLVQYYTKLRPNNPLSQYIPALVQVNGTDSHKGLGNAFVAAWKQAAADPFFQQSQEYQRDQMYFNPSVAQAKDDGLRTLGQFIYYDAIVMHGPGNDPSSFGGLRASVIKKTKPPAQGGDEKTYLNAFLDARKRLMLSESAHDNTSRVDTEQRVFLNQGNLDLTPPLKWMTYSDSYQIL